MTGKKGQRRYGGYSMIDVSGAVTAFFMHVSYVVSSALSGDVGAMSILLFLSLLSIYIINRITSLFMPLIRPMMLMLAIATSSYMLFTDAVSRIASAGLTVANAVFVSALSFAIVGAAYFLFLEFSDAGRDSGRAERARERKTGGKGAEDAGRGKADMKTVGDIVNPGRAVRDNRVWSLLLYLLITEFGVFSSKTITAPSEYSGLLVFVTFVFLTMVFVFQFYERTAEGLAYLFIAYAVGGICSIVLGIVWGGYSLSELLSLKYFKSDAMVALMSGVAVSLFMNR